METMSNPNIEPNPEYWSDLLHSVFADRKVIVVGEVIAGLVPLSKRIRDLGAESTFMLATEGMGTGDQPTKDDDHWLALDPPHSADFIESIHNGQKVLGNLPHGALAALDWYDPECKALVVGTFLNEHELIAGRTALAYRKPEWLALDDKTVIDSVWDKIGIPREPSEVIEVDAAKLRAAFARIDRGDGVVWSGDSKEGVSGGAIGTRWIKNEADAVDALGYYQQNCDRLRVMPFLEGIPCSIHGMVFSDYVAAFRPVEMVVLRKYNSNEFFYAGTSTYWDPAPDDREAMRDTAKQVGDALRDMVDYRGLFTIDGVMTKNGFRPTEMNTRSGAGVKALLGGVPELPLELISQALVSGENLDYKPKELESLVLASADTNRQGGTWHPFNKSLEHIADKPLELTENGWQWADTNDKAPGTVNVGPGPLGCFVRFTSNANSIKSGQPFAFTAKDIWQFIDQNVGTEIGQLEAAKLVR